MSNPRRSRAFAAVLAVLFLTTSAVGVLAAGRAAPDGARLGALAVDSVRARFGARAGAALALSAERRGLESNEIVVDPALPVITFTETTENDRIIWVIRASSGDAADQRTHTP